MTPDFDEIYLRQEAFANFIGLSARRVSTLTKEGVFELTDEGYAFGKSAQAYIKYLQERANGKGKTTTTAERAKNKKLIAEAERAELELAIKKGEYVEVGEVKEAWVTMVSRFKSKMLALPTKLAASCYGKSKPQIQAEAKAGIREALEELADDESD